jgi:hypothetical protein
MILRIFGIKTLKWLTKMAPYIGFTPFGQNIFSNYFRVGIIWKIKQIFNCDAFKIVANWLRKSITFWNSIQVFLFCKMSWTSSIEDLQ